MPGLTKKTLAKYPPRSVATIKGHLDQTRKNQRSTKLIPTEAASLPPDDSDVIAHAFPPSDPDNERTHHCYAGIVNPAEGQIYTDQTDKFIVASSTGSNYILVLYDYDSNNILVEPMRSRSGPCILRAFQTLHARLVTAGLRPKLHRLDNECSTALKQFLHDADIDFQLVPPGMHRRNAAERAIRTFKNHFIAGLCSVDQNFPLHLWDKLLPQAELTLNLLRGSRINPKLSAHAQLHGTFDFNRTPLAPPGIRVLVHVKPSERTTWSPHAADGWYVGPAVDSYRCYTVWMWDSRATRICDTLTWFPTKVTMPLANSNDLILAGIQDILQALRFPSAGSPLAPLTDSHHNALKTLSTILTSLVDPTPQPTTDTPIATSADPVPTSLVPPQPTVLEATPQSEPVRSPTLPISPDPSLRVLPDQTPATTLSSLAPERPPLRVEPLPSPPPPTPNLPARGIHFAPLPATPHGATFHNSTGSIGNRRRRHKRNQPLARPLALSKTIHPRKSTPKPRPTPTHSHGTRASTQPLHHVAAAVRTLLLDHARDSPLNRFSPLPPVLHYALHGNAFNPDTGNIAEYRELSQCSDGPLWLESNCEEIGRLAQGYKQTKGTNTIYFIPISAVPQGRKATYLRVVSAMRPEKVNPRRVRWTVGGDKVEYPHDVSTKTADLTTAKLLINSVLSTPNGRFMCIDIKDFYLGTPMAHYEYMRIPLHMLPDAIIQQYDLLPLVHNGHVYVEIRRGMYGLPQAGKLANDQLVKFLAPHGYEPVPLTAGLWRHKTRDIVFSLVVDDFGVRYSNRADVDHLISVLQEHYQVSTDWTGGRYCGLTLAWNYPQRTCDLSMPGYIERTLQRFQHVAPTKAVHSPHPWQRPNYGAKTQFTPTPDDSPALDAKDKLRILEVLGTLLYYARAVDSTLLTAIGELATEQSVGTKHTMDKLTQLLNYCASHPDATIRYTASDMVLAVESDASYLSVTKGRSRAAGFFFLTNHRSASTDSFKSNGAVHVLCHIMREVLSSAAEAELGALFHNGKESCPLRIALEEMGHPQPATPITTDNNTASGIATDSVKQKRSKAIDMRFHWIRDRLSACARANSKSTGARALLTVPIIFPSTIPHRTIRPYVPRTCILPRILRKIISSVSLTRTLSFQGRLRLLLLPLVRVCCSPRVTRRAIMTPEGQ